MKKNEIPDHLPDVFYVVTRERIRAGKPIMKIKPFEYVLNRVTGEKSMIMASVYPKINGTQYTFPLPYCYLTIEDALIEVKRIVNNELLYEKDRLNRIKEKLLKSEILSQELSMT